MSAIAKIPKNTLVTYNGATATLSYADASWKDDISAIEIFSCQSTNEASCTLIQSVKPNSSYALQLTGAGLYFVDLKSKALLDAYEITSWTQFVAILPVPTNDISSLASTYVPTISFNESETYFPVTIDTLFERNLSDLHPWIFTVLQEKNAGIHETDRLSEYMRYNSRSDNFILLDANIAKAIKGTKGNFPIYWYYDEDATKIWITYFFLYGYDTKNSTGVAELADHSIDRESITIRFLKSSMQPEAVIYGGHYPTQPTHFRGCATIGCGTLSDTSGARTAGIELANWETGRTEISWSRASKSPEDGRLVAYIANGSHAVQPGFGWYGIEWGFEDMGEKGVTLEPAGSLVSRDHSTGQLIRLDLSNPFHASLTYSGYSIVGLKGGVRLFPFERYPAAVWSASTNTTFSDCVATLRGCESYVEKVKSTVEAPTGSPTDPPPSTSTKTPIKTVAWIKTINQFVDVELPITDGFVVVALANYFAAHTVLTDPHAVGDTRFTCTSSGVAFDSTNHCVYRYWGSPSPTTFKPTLNMHYIAEIVSKPGFKPDPAEPPMISFVTSTYLGDVVQRQHSYTWNYEEAYILDADGNGYDDNGEHDKRK